MKKYLKIICNLLYTLLIIWGLVFLLPKGISYFMPFVIGFLFSLLVSPIVRLLEKHIRLRRSHASVFIVVLTIALIGFAIYGLGGFVASGIQGFLRQLPSLAKGLETELSAALLQIQGILNNIPFIQDVDLSGFMGNLSKIIDTLIGKLGENGIQLVANTAKNIPATIVNTIICLLAAYFFTADREKILSFLKSTLSQNFLDRMAFLYRQTIGAVAGYFKAQLKIMCVIYAALLVGLILLKIRYAWLAALGIAFLDMLPVFGTGTILLPWAAIKLLTGSYQSAIGMLILYAVTFLLHQFIQPKLIGDSMGMDPFAALFFMFIGYRNGSVFGMLISFPVGMILINMAKAGIFDNQIWCMKELIRDFNSFRKIEKR